ncbi:ClpP/crotonase [Auricularia subglabra TFB-10046 SS5]|nr:ClpP/crotonase [Auricularia subglabra TFB-10046 SS5]
MSYPMKLPKQDPVATITHPSPETWILELHNGPENRLSARVLREAIIPALNIVEREWRLSRAKGRKAKDEKAGHGSLVIVGDRSQDKFFSNGLQYEDVLKNYNLFIHGFVNPVLARLLAYPIPVVCAMNGHTFAGAFVIAMACDYRVMAAGKAWASMNEIHFGAPMPQSCIGVLKAKTQTPAHVNKILLEGHRFVPKEMLALGLVDELVDGGTEAVLEKAVALGRRWAPHAKDGVYGLHKREIYKAALDSIQDRSAQMFPPEEEELFMDSVRAHL